MQTQQKFKTADGESLQNVVQLKAISKSYANGEQMCHALKHVDLAITAGEFVSILGKSGSGKSTLLNLLSGIDVPSSGQILINSENLQDKTTEQLDAWRGRNIGLIFQFFQLMPTLTALENVMLPMDFIADLPLPQRRARAIKLLGSVQLEDKLNMFPASLSGGEKQRVAIARSLANDAGIILADEPTGNLDSATAQIIYKLFDQLNQQGKTVIIVSHDTTVCNFTHRTLRLADGEVVSDQSKGGGRGCG